MAGKGEVNQQTLLRDGGLHRGRVTRRPVLHLGHEAGGTVIKDRVLVLELRRTSNVIVSMVKTVVAAMGKSLMPEKAISSHGEAVQVKFALDRGRGAVEIGGKRTVSNIT